MSELYSNDSNLCQGMNVIYEADYNRCQICHCVDESNGKFVCLSDCNHTYHIGCLIDYSCNNDMKCPKCNTKFYDIRLSLAVAYKRGDTQGFINVLRE
jgi:hypothetical protein